jgi:hypothetical protein
MPGRTPTPPDRGEQGVFLIAGEFIVSTLLAPIRLKVRKDIIHLRFQSKKRIDTETGSQYNKEDTA